MNMSSDQYDTIPFCLPPNVQMNPFSLKFDPETEAIFRQDYYYNIILRTRPAIILGMIFYLSFYLLDLLFLPDVAPIFFKIRFFIVGPIILLVYILSFSEYIYSYNQIINVLGNLAAGGGIVAMTLIQPEYTVNYYAGIILVLIYNYILMGLRFYAAVFSGWTITMAYVLGTLFFTELPISILSANYFFLMGGNILLMFGAHFTEVLHRRDFSLRFQLRSEQDKVKTINEGLETRIVQRTTELRKEIAERKEAQSRIQHTLQEKEILLREVYHRTKNNMNVVISLLSLQATEQKKRPSEDVFSQVSDRIYSMSLVHDQLYHSDDLATINFIDYLQALVYRLQSIFQKPHVKLTFQCEPFDIGLQEAVPMGLVANEIITNIFKHGFPDDRVGELVIVSRIAAGGTKEIQFANDGAEFPETIDVNHPETLGLRIVQMLIVDQLGGSFALEHDDQVVYRLEIPGDVETAL